MDCFHYNLMKTNNVSPRNESKMFNNVFISIETMLSCINPIITSSRTKVNNK